MSGKSCNPCNQVPWIPIIKNNNLNNNNYNHQPSSFGGSHIADYTVNIHHPAPPPPHSLDGPPLQSGHSQDYPPPIHEATDFRFDGQAQHTNQFSTSTFLKPPSKGNSHPSSYSHHQPPAHNPSKHGQPHTPASIEIFPSTLAFEHHSTSSVAETPANLAYEHHSTASVGHGGNGFASGANLAFEHHSTSSVGNGGSGFPSGPFHAQISSGQDFDHPGHDFNGHQDFSGGDFGGFSGFDDSDDVQIHPDLQPGLEDFKRLQPLPNADIESLFDQSFAPQSHSDPEHAESQPVGVDLPNKNRKQKTTNHLEASSGSVSSTTPSSFRPTLPSYQFSRSTSRAVSSTTARSTTVRPTSSVTLIDYIISSPGEVETSYEEQQASSATPSGLVASTTPMDPSHEDTILQTLVHSFESYRRNNSRLNELIGGISSTTERDNEVSASNKDRTGKKGKQVSEL